MRKAILVPTRVDQPRPYSVILGQNLDSEIRTESSERCNATWSRIHVSCVVDIIGRLNLPMPEGGVRKAASSVPS